jgi:purine-binding chemotaxis protein CheW
MSGDNDIDDLLATSLGQPAEFECALELSDSDLDSLLGPPAAAGPEGLEPLINEAAAETVPSSAPSPVTPADVEIPGRTPGGDAQTRRCLIFGMGDLACALPIANVTEIGRPLAVMPIPFVPAWILGISNLRGDLVSIVDLRAFLGLCEPGIRSGSRLVVVRSLREDIQAGLIVDEVKQIVQLPARPPEPAAPLSDPLAPYLQGICDWNGRMLALIDAERLLLSPAMRQIESSGQSNSWGRVVNSTETGDVR